MYGSEYRPFCCVHPASRESIGLHLVTMTGNVGVGTTLGGAWPTANLAIAIPFNLPVAARLRQLGLGNGTVSGNIDVGIYGANGEKIISMGSTAQSGANVIQLVDVTDTNLPAGDYYLACALDNTTGQTRRISTHTAPVLEAAGVRQMASAFPLPSTFTFAAPANAYLPFPVALFGRIA